jgi:cholinesterase
VQPSVPAPVMVFIHGGAFMRGSSSTDMYGPDYLLKKDIVLVTFNYRIGALGVYL